MAFGISFTRTFKHSPWVDAVDRVSAAGDNGFNIRFKRLEEDLDTIGRRFTDVSTALDSLAVTKAAVRTVALPALLTTFGASGWDLVSTPGTARLDGEAEATGAMPVVLPNEGTILGFQAFGSIPGPPATVRIDLARLNLDGTGQKTVVRIQASSTEAFRERAPNPSDAAIEPKASYCIIATVNGTAADTAVQLTGFSVRVQEG
ncbi:hypothetical protein AB0F30_27545 [Streptomyces sp. NPDC029006]|uniref:hypothetical protein n=1 Tax=Streptomyces sp. NPDC029006 TaxID=3155467 RepID=UPI0033F173BA